MRGEYATGKPSSSLTCRTGSYKVMRSRMGDLPHEVTMESTTFRHEYEVTFPWVHHTHDFGTRFHDFDVTNSIFVYPGS